LRRALEVLAVATHLGLTSFGGPVAHLGYFRQEYVARRRWVDEQTYVDLVALCQMLPGPSSSQVGIAKRPLRPRDADRSSHTAISASAAFIQASRSARRPRSASTQRGRSIARWAWHSG